MGDGRLAGKIVLLTGIASGMGRVTAQLFAREGATVIGCDLDEAGAAETVRQITAVGGVIEASAPVDLGDRAAVQNWVDEAVAAYGRIDVLYNNASTPRFAPFGEQSEDDYLFTVRNELHLVWIATQAAWPHLVASRGAVVNIGSVAGMQGARGLPQAAHAATKGAVIALTRQLAAEGMADGVRVNAVSPGVIGTPPILAMLAASDGASPVDAILERTLTGRPGDPLAVAHAGLYLASEESAWVTGSNIVVDGGANSVM
jgi:meso-butanediol dehydrogenase / (S,S)-butanediol dehydrogenase / diacetyl reductase